MSPTGSRQEYRLGRLQNCENVGLAAESVTAGSAASPGCLLVCEEGGLATHSHCEPYVPFPPRRCTLLKHKSQSTVSARCCHSDEENQSSPECSSPVPSLLLHIPGHPPSCLTPVNTSEPRACHLSPSPAGPS